jgi:hypothetical protein
MGEMRNAYKILIRKPEGKRSHGKLVVVEKIILECILEKVWEDVDCFSRTLLHGVNWGLGSYTKMLVPVGPLHSHLVNHT